LLDAWGLLRDTTVAVSAIPRGEVYDVSSPTKTVEYLALGIPVVVNDIPDQEDLVNETGGGICCRMEPDTFADAIAKVLEDRETYARSAVACRKRLLEQRGYDGLSQLVAAQLRRTIADYGRGKRA
jgi:glycosyltransferase involved in cell wall biosynthesis